MSWLGIIGALLPLLALRFAFVRSSNMKIAVFCGAWLLHLAATLAYYVYVQSNMADTHHYYHDYHGIYYRDFALNTYMIVWLVQSAKQIVGGTYLDYFMLFQAVGFWGIALLMRIFDEIWAEVGLEPSWPCYLIFFLPGIHFWTSAIGKDAPMFLAIVMMLWATMQMSRRWIYFLVAFGLMIVVRPYVALLALAALGAASLFDPRRTFLQRSVLLGLAFVGTAIAASTVQMTFGVDVTSPEALGDYVTSQAETFETVEGGTSVVGASFPEKLLSLLYRPLFLDAVGAFGLVASFDNLILLIGTVLLLARWRTLWRLSWSVFFMRYAAAFGLMLLFVFSLLYYNVGLGLRQKVMAMPMFYVMFVAVLAVSRVQSVAAHYLPRRSLA